MRQGKSKRKNKFKFKAPKKIYIIKDIKYLKVSNLYFIKKEKGREYVEYNPKKKTIGISSRKGKARELQKWVCKKISAITDIPWGKDEDIESREMGQSGVDVKLRGEAAKLFRFSIECKRQEQWSVSAWIEQTKENQKKDTDWLLFCKRNHENPVVIMDAEAFFKIKEEISSLSSLWSRIYMYHKRSKILLKEKS